MTWSTVMFSGSGGIGREGMYRPLDQICSIVSMVCSLLTRFRVPRVSPGMVVGALGVFQRT